MPARIEAIASAAGLTIVVASGDAIPPAAMVQLFKPSSAAMSVPAPSASVSGCTSPR